jgi:hypothetical protein
MLRAVRSMPNGLIDGREVFAYLLNDVFGRPLLHADDAHGVAQRGANAVAKARRQTGGQKTTKAAHEAAMRIAARAAADGAPPAAVAAYQKLLGTYNLDLPARTVGRRVRLAEAGAATAAAAAETAAEAATAEAAAEPVEASSKLDNLEKAERSARTAVERAADALRADEARVERAKRRLDALGPRPCAYEWRRAQPDAAGYLNALAAWRDYPARRAARDARWAQVIAPFEHAQAAVEAARAEAATSRKAHGDYLAALMTVQDAAWEAAVTVAAEARAAAAASAAKARACRAEVVRLCRRSCDAVRLPRRAWTVRRRTTCGTSVG